MTDDTQGTTLYLKAPRVFAYVGERVTCPNGHMVAIITVPLVEAEPFVDRLNFLHPNGQTGMAACICACGSQSHRWNGSLGMYQLMIGGEFRPAEAVKDKAA